MCRHLKQLEVHLIVNIYQCQSFHGWMLSHCFTNNITFTVHHIHNAFWNPWNKNDLKNKNAALFYCHHRLANVWNGMDGFR